MFSVTLTVGGLGRQIWCRETSFLSGLAQGRVKLANIVDLVILLPVTMNTFNPAILSLLNWQSFVAVVSKHVVT